MKNDTLIGAADEPSWVKGQIMRYVAILATMIVAVGCSTPATPVDHLDGLSIVQPLPDGSVYLQIENPEESGSLELQMCVEGGSWGEDGQVRRGQSVGFLPKNAVGAGFHWMVFTGVRDDGRLLFWDHATFYNIVPEWKRFLSVAPYGSLPTNLP